MEVLLGTTVGLLNNGVQYFGHPGCQQGILGWTKQRMGDEKQQVPFWSKASWGGKYATVLSPIANPTTTETRVRYHEYFPPTHPRTHPFRASSVVLAPPECMYKRAAKREMLALNADDFFLVGGKGIRLKPYATGASDSWRVSR